MSRATDTAKPPSTIAGILSASLLTLLCSLLAIIAWRSVNPGSFEELSPYEIFPLFGLLSFTFLWCLYITDATANYLEVANETLRPYYRTTGYLLLVTLLAHPLLLIIPLWRDGFGLPPGSYEAYVGQSLLWVVSLGTLALLAFLAYELHRWFKERKWWKWVLYANDLAMLAIFYHGLTLGGELQGGWFRTVWFIYGVMLVIALIYLRIFRHLSGRAAADQP